MRTKSGEAESDGISLVLADQQVCYPLVGWLSRQPPMASLTHRDAGLPVVRGRQSLPYRTHSGTGKAGENGQYSHARSKAGCGQDRRFPLGVTPGPKRLTKETPRGPRTVGCFTGAPYLRLWDRDRLGHRPVVSLPLCLRYPRVAFPTLPRAGNRGVLPWGGAGASLGGPEGRGGQGDGSMYIQATASP